MIFEFIPILPILKKSFVPHSLNEWAGEGNPARLHAISGRIARGKIVPLIQM